MTDLSPRQEKLKVVQQGHITFGAQSFLIYLSALEQSHLLSKDRLEIAKKKSVELLNRLKEGKISVESAIDQLNQAIVSTNIELPLPPHGCHYPEFDSSSLRGQVRAHLIAYQNFLCMEMKAGNLSYAEENPLFNETARIWQQIMRYALTPRNGMLALSQVISKANAKLNQNHRYPFPDANLYAE